MFRNVDCKLTGIGCFAPADSGLLLHDCLGGTFHVTPLHSLPVLQGESVLTALHPVFVLHFLNITFHKNYSLSFWVLFKCKDVDPHATLVAALASVWGYCVLADHVGAAVEVARHTLVNVHTISFLARWNIQSTSTIKLLASKLLVLLALKLLLVLKWN